MLGYELKVVKAGPSATEAQTAMNSIISLKPDGVLLAGGRPEPVPPADQQLSRRRSRSAPTAIVDPQKYGFEADFINNETEELAGKLMADWAVAKPAAARSRSTASRSCRSRRSYSRAFDAEMQAVCPSCKVRHVDIPMAEIGKDAPSRVVSDLQSHPNTKIAAFSTAEAGTGLPAALKAAGLKVKIIGGGPPPAILGYIKEGKWDAGIGVDAPTMLWAQVDALARLAAGEPVTEGEKEGLPPIQILTRTDITFDPTKGWTAYPDFAERFAKLWGAGSCGSRRSTSTTASARPSSSATRSSTSPPPTGALDAPGPSCSSAARRACSSGSVRSRSRARIGSR